jgi:hypothetical protein
MTAVRVLRFPFGETSFSQATYHVEGDTLIVRCTDEGFDRLHGPMEVFPPHRWTQATLYDERGWPLAVHLSEFGKQQAAVEHEASLAGVRR